MKFYRFCPVCGAAYSENQVESFSHACAQCNYTLFENQSSTVGAGILHEGKVLLAKRGRNPGKGLWNLPGGFVEPDESLEKAVEREIFEELNVRTTKIEFKFVSSPVEYIYDEHLQYNTDHFFLVEVDSHNFIPQDDVVGVEWFELNNLPADETFAFACELASLKKLQESFAE